MINSTSDMVIKKEKISPAYRAIMVIAIYHLIIVLGFALASFITMENKFINISFFDWDNLGRGVYVLFYFALLPFMFDLSEEAK